MQMDAIENSENFRAFRDCVLLGASAQDIYASTATGFANAAPVAKEDAAALTRREIAARKQFLRLYEHRINIVEPLQAHFGVSGKHILDFGCGTGALAVALALEGAQVVAVDPTALSLQACHWRARYFNLETSQLKTLQIAPHPSLPFADASFDMVTLNSVMEFIPDQREAYVHELLRLVRPGGHLVISTENGLFPKDHYTGLWLPRLRRANMIARNLPYGVDYFELRRWIGNSSRPVVDLSIQNRFNSIDKLARRQSLAGKHKTANALNGANNVFKTFCRTLLGLPSDIFLPYCTFVFQVREEL